MDGVQARTPKLAQFNHGNVSFELLIKSNTIISNLGKYKPKTINIEPIITSLNNVINTTECISKFHIKLLVFYFLFLLFLIRNEKSKRNKKRNKN